MQDEELKVLVNDLISRIPTGDQLIGFTSIKDSNNKSVIIEEISKYMGMQYKILVIDYNLSDFRLSRKWGEAGGNGLNKLAIKIEKTGNMDSIREYIYKTDFTNLYILPCNKASTKIKSINQQSLEVIFGYLKQEFDYIFIELSSLQHLNDIRMVTSRLDHILVTIKRGEVSRFEVDAIKKKFIQLKSNILGCVLVGPTI